MAACVSDDFDRVRHARQTRGRHSSHKNGDDKPYGEKVSSTSRASGRTTRHLDAIALKEKGTLAKGKLADLAVLSQDIFHVPPENLPNTSSVLTLVDGKIVYDAGMLRRQRVTKKP